ncbi:unnamed protein product [Amoebophrya sp. A120]|nr:unnamed protein product [Amoebophrya sp. A120]|eukprot:GSA120T00003227001.1
MKVMAHGCAFRRFLATILFRPQDVWIYFHQESARFIGPLLNSEKGADGGFWLTLLPVPHPEVKGLAIGSFARNEDRPGGGFCVVFGFALLHRRGRRCLVEVRKAQTQTRRPQKAEAREGREKNLRARCARGEKFLQPSRRPCGLRNERRGFGKLNSPNLPRAQRLPCGATSSPCGARAARPLPFIWNA